jgi:hypothetical protein
MADRKKALDLEARLAAAEARAAEAEAKAAAEAEARKTAEARAAEAEAKADKPRGGVGFVELKNVPSFARAAARHGTELGKAFDLLLTAGSNGKAYVGLHWDRRFIDVKGKKMPTRGIDCTPAEFAYVVQWIQAHPAECLEWCDWAERAATAAGLATE